jgi:hypothetical protein
MEASGTSINQGKSQIFFFNMLLIVQHNVIKIIGFPKETLPIKYLGAPLVEKSLCNIFWEELLSKMENKLAILTFRSLNLASKLVMLKYVLQSMPLYFLVLVAPKFILKAIQNL